jgi:hypothetical protein
MRSGISHTLALALALAFVSACLTSPAGRADEQEASSAVTARGTRVLAMDVGPGPGETVDAAVAKAKAAGVTTAVLNYNWSDLEPSAFQYQNAKLAADNLYYATSPHAMSVVLNIRPVAGPCRVVPPDLANLAWSDPVMTTRFGYLLTWIHGYLPDVTVQVMSVGTEVDSHLAPADYPAYKVFFEAARQNARALWGSALPVGTAVTWGSLATPGPVQAAILDLDEHADRVLTTYYPINGDFTVKDPYAGPVADIYAALLAVDGDPRTRGRTLDLIEIGYPTSAALNSSQAKQQVFISTMFGIWDAYVPRINTLVVNWETDLSELSAEVVAIGGWGGGSCQPAGSVPPQPAAPTITPHGAAGTQTWQYFIVAVNATGNSDPGPISTLTTGPATLSAGNSLQLTWAAVAGATQYKVMRLTSGGTPAQTGLIGTTTATTLDDVGLGVPTFSFQEFLRTLGYRTHTTPSTDKLGFTQLATEAHARGW